MVDAAHLWILAAALAVDALAGDPQALWSTIPHPVAAAGKLIAFLDRHLNRPRLPAAAAKMAGVAALAILVGLATAVGVGLEIAFAALPFGWIGTILVAAILIAGRSLYDHVKAVADAFAGGGLDGARKAVSRIVGRDPASLDEAGVSRAAIESLAENFSDGVVAPALWFALFGLPGLLAYKMVNTADSMIGHRTTRYEHFGWASARFDDLVNLPASRLSGLLVALSAPLAGAGIGHALATMWADAGKHRSPNAGWPEAAMAASLGIAIAGPRRYRGVLVNDPFINAAGRKRATPDDIRRALRVYLGAWGLLLLVAALSGGLVLGFRHGFLVVG